MQITFWHNTIWYLALLLLSIGELTAAFLKPGARKFDFAFWLAILGFTYGIEALLMLVFNSYTYYAGFTADHFQDAVLGNFISQISISATAILLCALSLRGYWILIFSAAYFLIDVLFASLGIYEHFWYSSVYTLMGFIPLFLIIKIWYQSLYPIDARSCFYKAALFPHIPAKLEYYITLFFGVFAAAGNCIITPLKLLGIRIFHLGIFPELSKDHTVAALIYGPVLTVLVISLYEWKGPLYLKAAVFAALFAIQWLLYNIGFIGTAGGWFIPSALLDLLGYYAWTVILGRCLKTRVSL